MSARLAPPPRRRAPRRFAWLSATRVTAGLAVLLFVLLLLAPLILVGVKGSVVGLLPFVGYLGLVVATWGEVARIQREPGAWLNRPSVRRALVAAIALDCIGVLAESPPGAQLSSGQLVLLVLLVLLNIVLGRATQRMATAPDSRVDERQEALRNRAHRLAYPVFAAVVAAFLAADVVSTPSRAWVEHVLGAGGFFVFLELLFVLPGMVLAVIEPSPPPSDAQLTLGRSSTRTRITLGLVALCVALPFLASLSVVVLPVRSSTHVARATSVSAPVRVGSPASVTTLFCRYVSADVSVGWGASADLPVNADVCWDGRRAAEDWGMNQSDCQIMSETLVSVASAQCDRHTAANGTLTFTQHIIVSPTLLPFLTRQLVVQVAVDKHGHVGWHT
jgi:hypothetical protein